MALVGNELFIADTDALVKVPFHPRPDQDRRQAGQGHRSAGRPDQPSLDQERHRFADGAKLYVTVGSNSNVGERGMAVEKERAAVWEVDTKTGEHRIWAYGMRNPNGMAWEPTSEIAVDRGQRARRTRLGHRPRLSDAGAVRRLLRLALVLLGWRARQPAQGSGYGRSRPNRDPAGLCARRAHRLARPRLADGAKARAAICRGRLHRPARLVEPQASQRATR
jgi:hypothetical protein